MESAQDTEIPKSECEKTKKSDLFLWLVKIAMLETQIQVIYSPRPLGGWEFCHCGSGITMAQEKGL